MLRTDRGNRKTPQEGGAPGDYARLRAKPVDLGNLRILIGEDFAFDFQYSAAQKRYLDAPLRLGGETGAATVIGRDDACDPLDGEYVTNLRNERADGRAISGKLVDRANQDRYAVHIDDIRGVLATTWRGAEMEDRMLQYTEIKSTMDRKFN